MTPDGVTFLVLVLIVSFFVSVAVIILWTKVDNINLSSKTIRLFAVSAAVAATVAVGLHEWHTHQIAHFTHMVGECLDDPTCNRYLTDLVINHGIDGMNGEGTDTTP